MSTVARSNIFNPSFGEEYRADRKASQTITRGVDIDLSLEGIRLASLQIVIRTTKRVGIKWVTTCRWSTNNREINVSRVCRRVQSVCSPAPVLFLIRCKLARIHTDLSLAWNFERVGGHPH